MGTHEVKKFLVAGINFKGLKILGWQKKQQNRRQRLWKKVRIWCQESQRKIQLMREETRG